MDTQAAVPVPAVRGLISHRGTQIIGRQDLLALPTPDPTESHRPIAHAKVVGALIEALGFRRLQVVGDEYAVTPDGNRMFGVLALDLEENGVRVSIGIRNSHDKTFSLGITIGYRVFVCDNLMFLPHVEVVAGSRRASTRESPILSSEQCRLIPADSQERSIFGGIERRVREPPGFPQTYSDWPVESHARTGWPCRFPARHSSFSTSRKAAFSARSAAFSVRSATFSASRSLHARLQRLYSLPHRRHLGEQRLHALHATSRLRLHPAITR